MQFEALEIEITNVIRNMCMHVLWIEISLWWYFYIVIN